MECGDAGTVAARQTMATAAARCAAPGVALLAGERDGPRWCRDVPLSVRRLARRVCGGLAGTFLVKGDRLGPHGTQRLSRRCSVNDDNPGEANCHGTAAGPARPRVPARSRHP